MSNKTVIIYLVENLAVLALTGFVFWLTRNPFSFLILLCANSLVRSES